MSKIPINLLLLLLLLLYVISVLCNFRCSVSTFVFSHRTWCHRQMLFPQCYSFHGMLQLHFLRSNKGSQMHWMVQKLHSKIFRCYDQQKGQFQVKLWNVTIRKQKTKNILVKGLACPSQ